MTRRECQFCGRAFTKASLDSARQAVAAHQKKCPQRKNDTQPVEIVDHLRVPAAVPAASRAALSEATAQADGNKGELDMPATCRHAPSSLSSSTTRGGEESSPASSPEVGTLATPSSFDVDDPNRQVLDALAFLSANEDCLKLRELRFTRSLARNAEERLRLTPKQRDWLFDIEADVRVVIEQERRELEAMRAARHHVEVREPGHPKESCKTCLRDAEFERGAREAFDRQMTELTEMGRQHFEAHRRPGSCATCKAYVNLTSEDATA